MSTDLQAAWNIISQLVNSAEKLSKECSDGRSAQLLLERAWEIGREVFPGKLNFGSGVDTSCELDFTKRLEAVEILEFVWNNMNVFQDYKSGLAVSGRLLEIDPKESDQYTRHGLCLTNLKRHEEAIENFNIALRFNPNSLFAHVEMGVCMWDQGDISAAKEWYDRAEEIDPTYYVVLRDQCQLAMEMGDIDLAVHYLERALEGEVSSQEISQLVTMASNFEEHSTLLFETMARCLPDNTNAQNNAGAILQMNAHKEKDENLKIQMMERARSYFQKAIEDTTVPPERAAIYQSNMGMIYNDMDKPDDAKKYFLRAIEISPGYVLARKSLVNIFDKQKKLYEASEQSEAIQFLLSQSGADTSEILEGDAKRIFVTNVGGRSEKPGLTARLDDEPSP